ncbi:hypothetical protein Hypma_006187 [Hypsizygus marmoreus]|uniref:BTB domain-containing protein n=1 Tax=Hypsizygus marmoreus TaxID=39966 RepID=A0A369K1H0_HYPMA|nr:hypothetical protein Hypma_006187 [Hypsizygus marmoreus]
MAHHSSDSGSFFALSRHDDYWINGGDLYFLVEHVQYRVHRYFFERESPFFKSRLTTPASPGASRQGSAESNAIVLENVRSADFAKFLWVFYNPKYSLYHTTVEDWTTILDLAHQWQFTEVKNLVVRELEKLEIPDVNRISTYHKYDIDRNLLISRYAALCEREDPLTLKEGLLLGMDTTLMIARTREYARSNPTPTGARSPTAAHIRQDEMHSLVRLLFEIQPPAEGSEDQGDATKTAPGGLPQSQTEPPTQKPPSPPPTVAPPVVQDKDKPEQPTGQPQAGKKKAKKGKQQQPTAQPAPSTPVVTTPTIPSVPPLLPEAGEAVAKEAAAVANSEAPLLHLETKDLLVDLVTLDGEATAEQKKTEDGKQKAAETAVEGENKAVEGEKKVDGEQQGIDGGAGDP